MKSNTQEDFTHVEDDLRSLYSIHVTRDANVAGRNRSRYLSEIKQLTVSNQQKSRHTFQNRIDKLFGTGKDGFKMTPAMVSVITALVLFFGGGAVTASASQNSLPNDLLFPIKLATEDIRTSLATGDEDLFNLELQLSKTRFQETMKLLEQNTPPDEEQYSRLETHLNNALNLAVAAQTKNSGELQKLQNQLREQVQSMEQLQTTEKGQISQARTRINTLLETQSSQVDNWIESVSTQDTNGQNGIQGLTQDQIKDQTQDQLRDQTRDQTQDLTRDQIQDQTRDQIRQQTQQQFNINNGTPTPPATMVPNGNYQNYGVGNGSSGSDATGSGSGYGTGSSSESTGSTGSTGGSGNGSGGSSGGKSK